MFDIHRPQSLTLWGLFQAAALLVLLALVYAAPYAVLVNWWNNDDYSYCYLLPLVMGWILWGKRHSLRALADGGGWSGLAFLGLGALLYALGEFGSEYYSLFLSSWFAALGLCWLFFGRAVARSLGFVFLLFFAMLPLPQFLGNKLTVQLQLVSTRLGEVLIRLLGMSVYREGNIIDLGFMQLQVVEACSGLRYLFPLLVLGLVLAYFSRLRLWKQCLLVAAAMPISLVLNALRIALTALASKLFGPRAAQGFSHDFAGWAVFLLSFGLLYGLSLLLARLPGGPRAAETADPAEAAGPAESPLGRRPGLRFWIAAAVLAAMFFGLAGRGGQEQPPQSRPFAQFPMHIGPWTGAPQALDTETLNTLKLSQYILADYHGPDRAEVNLYVAYYRSQQKGQAIHSPESCLPGTGWTVEEDGVVDAAVAGAARRVNRSLASKGPSRILTWFWFAQQGRMLTSLPELKLSTFFGALTRRRTDGALVRLSTALGPYEQAAQGDERLRRFLVDVEPSLRAFVPD